MLKNLNFTTRLGAATTSALIVSAIAAIVTLALTVVGASEIAAAIAVLALLAVAACALIANTQITAQDDQVDQVVAVAAELTANRLPRLTGSLFDDDDLSGFDEFPGGSDEGLGRIVKSLNAVQAQTRDAALEQRTQVREGVSNLVINLVRRNQGLLERQLFHIDRLESTEEDPERLEDLYGVDHLASRMRRNAESLLVLAGLDPQRRKGDPISVNDLMRVAMGEIEGYQNVRIVRVDDGDVSAQAALDIAHLLSELLENATQFSPPTATVELAGRSQSDGAYLISISDAGIGMSHDQLEQYNQLLSDPPELSLGLSRSLGFLVVGRLAQRLGVTVELAPAEVGAGVAALVLVPASLLGGDATPDQPALETPAETSSEPADVEVVVAVDDVEPPAPTAASSSPPSMDLEPDQLESTPGDDEPAWVPPAIPERGSGGLGAPPSPAEPDLEPTVPAEHEPVGADAAPAAPPQSEALAKLLGIDPGNNERPQRLEEAIPSGEHFDAGVAGLLADSDSDSLIDSDSVIDAASAPPRSTDRRSDDVPKLDAGPTGPGLDPRFDGPTDDRSAPGDQPPAMPAQRTAKGLAKRDRSKSSAPIGEGRVIPDGGTSVTASTRDPEEIRDMLARYRKAREGTNPDGSADRGGAQ